jgi:hypothetical protein
MSFPQIRSQSVNVMRTLTKRSGEALLSTVKKEMKAPRKPKSVRAADAKLRKAKRKST